MIQENSKLFSIKGKLIVLMTTFTLLISTFTFFYFPAKQKTVLEQENQARISTVTEMVALGAGIGLGTDQLIVVKNVFDWAKLDSNLKYIAVLDKSGDKISQFPKDLQLDIAALKNAGDISRDNGIIRVVKEIKYNNQMIGTVLLGADLSALNNELSRTRVAAAIVSLVILIFGVIVSTLLGGYFSKRLGKLVSLADAVKSGDYSTRLDDSGQDEIKLLGNSMLEMSTVLQSKEQEVNSALNEANEAKERAMSALLDSEAKAASLNEMGRELQEKQSEIAGALEEANVAKERAVVALRDSEAKATSLNEMSRTLQGKQDEIAFALKDAEVKVSYLNTIPAPIMTMDTELNLVFMNKCALDAAGTTIDVIKGRKCFDFFKNPHCNTDQCCSMRAIRDQKVHSSETTVTAWGKQVPIMYTSASLTDHNGNVTGALEYISDISNIRKVVDEVSTVAARLQKGSLKDRVYVEGAEGDYKRLIDSFNSAIDNILKPIDETISCLKHLAEGNLTVRITGDYSGDHAALKEALNSTLEQLNELLIEINVTVDQVTTGAEQVSSASQSLSHGANEQASSLEEISSAMTEIGAQTNQNASNATFANKLSDETKEKAELGNKHMNQMLKAMNDINESSSQVSKIIKVIDEIAFQTNLLALNAAVEAARAGEHGKGFAVVAEEVRSLAQRSAKAAKETSELIEGSKSRVDNGTKIAQQTAKALEEIASGVRKVSDLINNINSASSEQAAGFATVNTALSTVDQVTQSNSAIAEESASSSEELTSQALHVRDLISRFKVSDSDGSNRPMRTRSISASTNRGLRRFS